MKTFISAPKLEATLVTRRDVFQAGAREENGHYSEEYRRLTAVVELSERDMKNSKIKDEDTVEISSPAGKVVVEAHRSEKVPKGMAVMPNGPWANVLISANGPRPEYKRVEVKIKPTDREVLALEELLEL